MPYPDDISGFDLGYLVGLFEGEGCITFQCKIRCRKTARESYFVHVLVGNTNKFLLDKIQRITGLGKVHLSSKHTGKKGEPYPYKEKPYYEWRLSAHTEVLWFLEQCLPHLIEKSDRAILVMQFLRSRIANYSIYSSPRLRGYTKFERSVYNRFVTKKEV